MLKKALLVGIILFFTVVQQSYASIETEVLEGTIDKIILNDVTTDEQGNQFRNQKLSILVEKGSIEGQRIIVETGTVPVLSQREYFVDDDVIISATYDDNGEPLYTISDFIRTPPLILLTAIFVIASVAVGGLKGASSLLGLLLSFAILAFFTLPQIIQGRDPVSIALVSSIGIMLSTFYLSHGFNRITTTAVAGTTVAISVSAILGVIFTEAAKLTGFSSDEALYLDIVTGGTLNMQGLVLAGMIIGTLGVLDDITISQTAIVAELKSANKHLPPKELFTRAMNIGREHIASLVNTLVLVYAGSALPLMLLFSDGSQTFLQTINSEVIAEEIVRTLIGSIGLILAVPLTTFIATYTVKHNSADTAHTHHHHH